MKRFLGGLLETLLRSPRIDREASRLYRWYGRHRAAAGEKHDTPHGAPADEMIGEIISWKPYPSLKRGKRLNICVPSLAERHAYGGVATALKLFDALSVSFEDLRIIVTDNEARAGDIAGRYADWPIVDAAHADADGHVIFQGANRGAAIPVRKGDVFFATAWWTAWLVQTLLRWQEAQYALVGLRYIYLIQDFEPGFYPWSSQYAIAEATYRHPERTIAIFNTRMLHDYFGHEGYRFSHVFLFEPALHEELARYRERAPIREKERLIVIYGRPGTPRNAFPIIAQAVNVWSRQDAGAAGWRIVSVGETHAPVPLARDLEVESLGKLKLADYAELLDRAAIGISLMISPHPSYPPLEMAAFGVRVVTNRYATKNLSNFHSGITSVSVPEPDVIATEVLRLCTAFEAERWTNKDGRFSTGSFLEGGPAFPFASALAHALGGGCEAKAGSGLSADAAARSAGAVER